MTSRLASLFALISIATPAAAQPGPAFNPPAAFNPAAEYITAGQDEPGYRRWVAQGSVRPMYVRAFHNYLVTNGVGGVAPTWQLLRTATDWQKCGAAPFEVPPTSEWANIVATLKFVGQYIIPAVGPVEPVSVYRNGALNLCAGGAQGSTHREMGAVDVVPLRATSRQALMVELCAVHLAHAGQPIGLGFYKGLRFHVDARKYREWGTTSLRGQNGCRAVLTDSGRSFAIPPPIAVRPPPSATLVPPVDPLAPQ